ncbi:MAG TPA: hypothetical protein EYH50_03855 [Pyrodictium delaneyi]|uniref:Uncharacterized protein n=1 Tax=Pyrodictium delaneyi TaxID=1273541 RepID=A0A832ZWR5_9CREN|nr:hypothetical protein [Pyrodictium delaneyi]
MRRYNPFLVQSLKRLDPVTLLVVLGETSWRLRSAAGEGFSKDAVVGVLVEVLEGLGRGSDAAYVASRQYPLLVNDLRRLGLVEAGDPLEEWPRDVEARVGPLVHRIVDAMEYCRNTCGDIDRCRVVGGAVAAVSLLGGVSAGSPGLRRVLARLYAGESLEKIAGDIASEIGASTEGVLGVLEAMRRLVEEAVRVAADAAEDGCVPRFYVPLGLRVEARRG